MRIPLSPLAFVLPVRIIASPAIPVCGVAVLPHQGRLKHKAGAGVQQGIDGMERLAVCDTGLPRCYQHFRGV